MSGNFQSLFPPPQLYLDVGNLCRGVEIDDHSLNILGVFKVKNWYLVEATIVASKFKTNDFFPNLSELLLPTAL